MGVRVEFQEEGERLVARPQGRLEAADADPFSSAILAKLQPGTKSVTIDLDELDGVSLGGIRAILRLARSLMGGQRSLDFVRGGQAVRHALEQAGLQELFSFTPALHPSRGHHDATS
ncbi:MAG TPA: STAS domain-containing protein [Sphingomicrobium sp.]|nr:STAS domain-containing protein [Sphingomicrobium sp.]